MLRRSLQTPEPQVTCILWTSLGSRNAEDAQEYKTMFLPTPWHLVEVIYELNEATEYAESRLLRSRPVPLKCAAQPTASTSLGSLVRSPADLGAWAWASESESLVGGKGVMGALTIPSRILTPKFERHYKSWRKKESEWIAIQGKESQGDPRI